MLALKKVCKINAIRLLIRESFGICNFYWYKNYTRRHRVEWPMMRG